MTFDPDVADAEVYHLAQSFRETEWITTFIRTAALRSWLTGMDT